MSVFASEQDKKETMLNYIENNYGVTDEVEKIKIYNSWVNDSNSAGKNLDPIQPVSNNNVGLSSAPNITTQTTSTPSPTNTPVPAGYNEVFGSDSWTNIGGQLVKTRTFQDASGRQIKVPVDSLEN